MVNLPQDMNLDLSSIEEGAKRALSNLGGLNINVESLRGALRGPITSEPETEAPGFLDIPVTALGEARDLAKGLVLGAGQLAKSVVTDPIGTLEATPGFLVDMGGLILDDYKRLFTQPLTEVKERPFITSLNVIGATGIIKSLARGAGLKGLEKVAETATKRLGPFETVIPIKPIGRQLAKTRLGQEAIEGLRVAKENFFNTVGGQRVTRDVRNQLKTTLGKLSDSEANSVMLGVKLGLKDVGGLKRFVDEFDVLETNVIAERLGRVADDLGMTGGVDELRSVMEGRVRAGDLNAQQAQLLQETVDDLSLLSRAEFRDQLARRNINLKWEPENLSYTDNVQTALNELDDVGVRFGTLLQKEGLITDAKQFTRKLHGFKSQTGLPEDEIARLVNEGILSGDDLLYAPHLFDKKFSAEKVQDLVGRVTQGQKLTVEILKNDSLKQNLGKSGRQFVESLRSLEDIETAFGNHVARQAKFISQYRTLKASLDRMVQEGNAFKTSVGSVLRDESGVLSFADEAGNVLPANEFTFVDMDGLLNHNMLINDTERVFLEGVRAGLDPQDILHGQIDDMLTETARKADPESLVHTRKFSDDLAEDGSKNVIAVRRPQANALTEALGLNQTKSLGFEWFFDTPTRLWRAMTLGLSPRWMVNNAIGNAILNFMDGVKLKDYVDFISDARIRASLPEEVTGVNTVAQDLAERVGAQLEDVAPLSQRLTQATGEIFSDDLVARVGGRLPGALQKLGRSFPFKWVAKVKDTIVNMNGEIERLGRGARAVRELKRLRSVGEDMVGSEAAMAEFASELFKLDRAGKLANPRAIELVNAVDQTLFNYSVLSPVEQNLMRKVFPFWTWHRNITMSAIMLPERHPLRIAMLSQLSRTANPELDTSRPDWLRGALQIGTADDGDAIYLNMRGANPYLDVLEVNPSRIGSSLNPLIKVAIEQVSGRDLFRERGFTDETTWTGYDGRQYRWNPNTGEAEQVTVRPNLFMHLARQVPQGSFLEDAVAEAMGATGLRQDVSTFITPTELLRKGGQPIEFDQPFGLSPAARKAIGFLTGGSLIRQDTAKARRDKASKDRQARKKFLDELRKQRAREANR